MLIALAGLVAALLALGATGYFRPVVLGPGLAALALGAGALALAALLLGGRWSLVLPSSVPEGGMALALDPLSAFFLLPVCLAAAAAGLAAGRDAPPLLPVAAAGMLLTLLAADRFTCVLGFATMAAACWGLAGGGGLAGVAIAGSACVLGALALVSPDPGFAAMRAAPPEGWRAAGALVLAVAGGGAAAGLAPLPRWLPSATAAASGSVCTLLTVGMAQVGQYVILRVTMDLCGPATPAWWGAPLLVIGAASAVLGAVQANRAAGMQPALAGLAVQGAGFFAAGLGVALAARGSDLPALAALALGGAMLHALNHGVAQTLAILAAGAAEQAAGTRLLDRLGGLVHPMKAAAAGMLVAAAALACLPLSAGFAGLWLLVQALLAAPRIGGLGLQAALAVVAAAFALAVALGSAAVVRLVGIAFLGRPRTPRAAAAEDVAGLARGAVLGLAGLTILLGLLPGLPLALTAGARRALAVAGPAAALDWAGHWAGIAVAADLPGYLPPGVALLAGAVALATWLLARRLRVPPARRVAPWSGGFAAAPPWLPFGDPATQYTAASLAAPVLAMLGGPRRLPRLPNVPRPPGWPRRLPAGPALALAVLLSLALLGMAAAAGMLNG